MMTFIISNIGNTLNFHQEIIKLCFFYPLTTLQLHRMMLCRERWYKVVSDKQICMLCFHLCLKKSVHCNLRIPIPKY
jgi:hypothetical protein